MVRLLIMHKKINFAYAIIAARSQQLIGELSNQFEGFGIHNGHTVASRLAIDLAK